ncbi:MAG: DUF2177 family protein [Armatimonadetes bacterium]|nr:DUF2177 family protein [Armatimonadota bacterium]
MHFKLFGITLPIFLAIDLLWIGVVAKGFYAKQIGFLFKTNINWAAAGLFYLIFIAGLVLFVIEPAVRKASLSSAVGLGAFFGLVCYATYDLTNLATVKDWPILVTVVDLAWGTTLGALVSGVSFSLGMKFVA